MKRKNKLWLSLLANSHGKYVFNRRVKVLSQAIEDLLPSDVSTLLDVGCGDGNVGYLIQNHRQSIKIQGLEIMDRNKCLIPYSLFDGRHIKLKDNAFDASMLVDVLHHEKNIPQLLKEVARVSKKYIIIKDHFNENKIDEYILSFMDWVGNRGHGVGLVYNYQSKSNWDKNYATSGLKIKKIQRNVPLYPFPFNWVFGRELHFIAVLEKKKIKS